MDYLYLFKYIIRQLYYIPSGSPLTPNPTIRRNVTHITLLWSPPFLWPGKIISYYNVSFTDKTRGISIYYRVNYSSNEIVPFSRRIHQSESLIICTEIVFSISAIGALEQLRTFIATDSQWIIPSSKNHAAKFCS